MSAPPDEVRARLALALPSPPCELLHHSPWQLLVATILSAQSTDRTINRVTPELFRRWPTPADLASAPQAEVEEVVRPTGFFRNKAKAIRGAAAALVERFDGQVPASMADLVTLPGVARKTANVVLSNAFGISAGVAVDTHAARVARRLGLTDAKDPVRIERDLCHAFPRETWSKAGLRLVLHGRYVCVAKKPRCAVCPLNELCPSREAAPEGAVEERARAEGEVVHAGVAASLGQ